MSNIDEYFIPLRGYEKLYEISNYGNIKDITGKILHRVKVSNVGFLITLYINNKKKVVNSGLSVAKTFIENTFNLVNIKYLDGNKFNCHVSNIEWSCKSTNKHPERVKILSEFIHQDEIFIDIKGYEGIYQISNYGKVMSLNYKKQGFSRLLKPLIKNSGYVKFNLNNNLVYTHPRCHRLVAEHFIDNPNNYEFVNHIDGNKLNNHVSNLEWCTMEYNNIHAKETGLLKPSNNTLLKNNPERVREIRARYINGETARQLAETYGISMDTVLDIKNYKTWKDVV